MSETEPLRERPDLKLRQCVLTGDACDTLVTGLMGLESLATLGAKTTDKLKHYSGASGLEKTEV